MTGMTLGHVEIATLSSLEGFIDHDRENHIDRSIFSCDSLVWIHRMGDYTPDPRSYFNARNYKEAIVEPADGLAIGLAIGAFGIMMIAVIVILGILFTLMKPKYPMPPPRESYTGYKKPNLYPITRSKKGRSHG